MWTSKAFNGRCISEWLQRCLSTAILQPAAYPDPEQALPLLLSAMCLGSDSWLYQRKQPVRTALVRFYGLAERAGRFLTVEEGKQMHETGLNLARRYVALVHRDLKCHGLVVLVTKSA